MRGKSPTYRKTLLTTFFGSKTHKPLLLIHRQSRRLAAHLSVKDAKPKLFSKSLWLLYRGFAASMRGKSPTYRKTFLITFFGSKTHEPLHLIHRQVGDLPRIRASKTQSRNYSPNLSDSFTAAPPPRCAV